ncbi:MAG TPA: PilT/PilU family type 4a pilus ATPase [Candidatus Saccharimonadales bacterium]|jgi:twitching motility protein PilT|nr:PilT/PilU family type 4a pilus ATPase [Candidatus Saccharimonadales bacterium]
MIPDSAPLPGASEPAAVSKPAAPIPAVAAAPQPVISTNAMLTAMLQAAPQVSDLIFSPGRFPQVEVNGALIAVRVGNLPALTAADTQRIAADIMAGNQKGADMLRDQGACDVSYSVPGKSRFRVNIFTQRGTCAIVMRAIPGGIPSFDSLKLPPQLREIVQLKNGIVLVTGPTGSGKSSTLASIVDLINETHCYHIVTIEDPIEFIHKHKKSTIHQRELHSDTPSFSLALRAALRQAPKVILVGEMRDRETMEIALEAAETGHLVLSTLHTVDASKTVERIIGAFPPAEEQLIRTRLANSFRWIVCQRLMPRKDGAGRAAAFEILRSNQRTREYLEKGEREGRSILDAIRDGGQDGMQCFDDELEKMVRHDRISRETALGYATNQGNLMLALSEMSAAGAVEAAPVKPQAGHLQDDLLETTSTPYLVP